MLGENRRGTPYFDGGGIFSKLRDPYFSFVQFFGMQETRLRTTGQPNDRHTVLFSSYYHVIGRRHVSSPIFSHQNPHLSA